MRFSATGPSHARSAVLVLAAAAIVLFPPSYSVRSKSISARADNPASFAHDAKGLERQYQPFIDAFVETSEQVHQAFAVFSLPNPADWFAKYFAKDQVEQLRWDYESELSTYERVLLRGMGAVPSGTKFRVRCKPPHADPTSRMSPRPDAILPSSPIPIEQFVTEFDPIRKLGYGKFSILVNYVYVDGAFRYVGRGAYPFWAMAVASQKK